MSKKFTKCRKGFKVLTLSLAFVLVVSASVAGTLAWLTKKTETVTNTFTSAELFDEDEGGSFTLWEHQAMDEDGDGIYTLNTSVKVTGNSYNILPGVDIPKNPTVDVVKLEGHAYLYVKVTDALATGMTYTIDPNNWTEVPGYAGVYVYSGTNADDASNVIKATTAATKTFTASILKDDKIVVADTYAAPSTDTDIKLSFEAYMVQASGNGTSAAAAWANTYGKTTD